MSGFFYVQTVRLNTSLLVMKTYIILASVIIAAFGAIQYYTMSSTNNTERQPYKTVEKDGKFEIRFYPSSTIASVTKKGDYESMSSAGFRDLAGYIFGGNSTGQKIAMTSPVIMEEETSETKMSFVMPSEYKKEDLPLPNNSSVTFSQTEPVYMATISYGGFSSAEKVAEHKEELVKWLSGKGIQHKIQHIIMSYNPPYQLVGRTNEVAFELIGYEN
jgi:hypothetical protein